MTIVFWIGAIQLIAIVGTFIVIIKVWQLLNEIISSGAIPNVLKERAKRDAQEILDKKYIYDFRKLEEIRRFLTKEEDAQLLNQLKKLEKQQT